MKFTPHAYQATAIKFISARREAALFLDPGLGKTAVTLSAFCALRKTGKIGPALVVAPLRVCERVWTHAEGGELAKWDDFRHLRAVLLHGPRKDQLIDQPADIYVINYEGLAWLSSKQYALRDGLKLATAPAPIEKLFKRGVSTLIWDELSKMKDGRSKRFKLIAKPPERGAPSYLSRFNVRWGLTGSPAANGLLDLFGECFVLDQGKALGQYITHYRVNYFVPSGFKGYQWELQPGAAERIYRQLENLALSMRAVDHLKGMPELIEENLWCDLPPDARKFYDGLEDDMIAELRGEVITAKSAGVVSGKLRQVAGGGIYSGLEAPAAEWLKRAAEVFQDVDPKVSALQVGSRTYDLDAAKREESGSYRFIHHAKTDALVDLKEELQGQPLLVGYWYRHDLVRIQEKLGAGVPVINGDTKEAQCAEIIRRWNAGKIPVLVGHPRSMGHGLNMQFGICGHVAFYTTPWDLDLYNQFIARVWRQGNTADHVVVSRIMCRNTIDDLVAIKIGAKAKVQDRLFDALKAYVENLRRKRK